MMSKLYFRYGAMNCGKSTNLQQVAYNYGERGMKAIILKPSIDSKGGNTVISRLGVQREVDILVPMETDVYTMIREWIEKKGRPDCILVDEVQFMKKEQIDGLFKVAVCLEIPTICYGLRTDFQMNGFEGSERLLLLAHSVEELKTICTCGKKATLNGRKVNGKYVFEGNQVAIDQENDVEYQSLCPSCYFKYKAEYEAEKNGLDSNSVSPCD
jgi:thymidine kinase